MTTDATQADLNQRQVNQRQVNQADVNQPEITQRDLRNKSRETMDAVESGQAFTVTRDGHRIGELVPLRHRRRFVPQREFAAGRQPRRRIAALMIAAIAVAEELPLLTTNPDDFAGLEDLLTVVPITRPRVP